MEERTRRAEGLALVTAERLRGHLAELLEGVGGPTECYFV